MDTETDINPDLDAMFRSRTSSIKGLIGFEIEGPEFCQSPFVLFFFRQMRLDVILERLFKSHGAPQGNATLVTTDLRISPLRPPH